MSTYAYLPEVAVQVLEAVLVLVYAVHKR